MAFHTLREEEIERLLQDERLRDCSRLEARAIVIHKCYLDSKTHRDVDLGEAIRSWEETCAPRWRHERAEHDTAAQLREIERHKYFLSEKAGRDVGWENAARDWAERHAAGWRRWSEDHPD